MTGLVARHARPFPHVVYHWPALARRVAAEFPADDDPGWRRYENQLERKLAREDVGPAAVEFRSRVTHPSFLGELRTHLGLPADLRSSWEGGGYHLLPAGGYLGMHVDFNVGADGLFRRANLLLYLNDPWDLDWGGELVLGTGRGQVAYRPEAGTLVAFPTGEAHWHGNPRPARHPRRSLALYLFSPEPPLDWPGHAHSTVFTEEPLFP